MNKQTFILVVIILAVIFVGWQLFWPAFVEVSDLRQELAVGQNNLEEVQNQKDKLEILKKKYESMAEEAQKASQLLPSKDDVPGLLVQVEALASQNGLILDSIGFSYPETSSQNQAASQSAAVSAASIQNGQITIDLSLSGKFAAFKNFLKAVENNLRLMNVVSVNFGESSSSAQDGAGLTSFKVSLGAYYRK